MGFYRVNLNEVVEYLNIWNRRYSLGLQFCGARDNRAAWLIGNRFVTAVRIAPAKDDADKPIVMIEQEDYTWSAPDQASSHTWAQLTPLLTTHFKEESGYPPHELGRIAEKTLEKIEPSQQWWKANEPLTPDAEAQFKKNLQEREPRITENALAERRENWRKQIESAKAGLTEYEEEKARRNGLTSADWLKEFFADAQATPGEPTANQAAAMQTQLIGAEKVITAKGLSKWETFHHIAALCNQDNLFSYYNAKTDEELGRISIGDYQRMQKEGQSLDAIIGMVSLLPKGTDTVILCTHRHKVMGELVDTRIWNMFDTFIQRVQNHFETIGRALVDTLGAVKKKSHGKWDDTETKLERLKDYRKEWIQKHNGETPKWTVACKAVGIDPKTARTHAKELRKHWEDKDY